MNINISIIISAKNEEKNISSLFQSLSLLNYPKENYEVIVINDGSADSTSEVIKNLIQNRCNYHLINAETKKFPGKKGALDLGISASKYEFIAITDADCIVPQNWLSEISLHFSKGSDFIIGNIIYRWTKNLVTQFACIENIKNKFLTLKLAENGLAYSAGSGNFAFRKSSFNRIGGYGNTLKAYSGDDDLLIQNAIRNKMNISVNFIPVITKAETNFIRYIHQKRRHVKTSHYYSIKSKLILGIWHSANILSIPAFLLNLSSVNFPFHLITILKFLFDLLLIWNYSIKYKYPFSVVKSLIFSIFYEIMVVFNFVGSVLFDYSWKDEKIKRKNN